MSDEFTPMPDKGDLLRFGNLVKEAGLADTEIKALEKSLKDKKALRQQLLEVMIPELALECGGIEKIQIAGFTVELVKQTFAGIPSPSAIEKEKDEDVRAEMIARRDAAVELLEEIAPSLLKRSYDIEFDRDSEEEAAEFEEQIKKLPNPPEFVRGLTVHPKTLAKYIKERGEEGQHLTDEQRKILGVMERTVAKITR